jgi:hypothetical protein
VNKITDKARIIGYNRVVYEGSFAPDTASAPTTLWGKGFTVARTSTGLFTLTLDSAVAQIDSVIATLQLATADDKFCQVGEVDASAGTVQIRVWDISGAAVADVAANANNRVNFEIYVRTSGTEI